MTTPRGYLVSVTAWVERSCEFDTLQRLLPHDHGHELRFADNDGAGVDEDLDAVCILAARWVQLLPCSVAQAGFVTCDVDVVLDGDAGSVERARFGRLEVTTGGYNDSLVCAGLGYVEDNEGKAVSAHSGQHVDPVGKLISRDSRGKV
jgi:hypothetical protein